jgi:hypothetical protein
VDARTNIVRRLGWEYGHCRERHQFAVTSHIHVSVVVLNNGYGSVHAAFFAIYDMLETLYFIYKVHAIIFVCVGPVLLWRHGK